ncbi:MAG: carboxypeptidase-like regulatory domain-containing protein [Lacibacter sp.]
MNYNAYDIERYLKRQMNAAEMHAFEKAMMDDPFLSDAVDGYRSQMEHINIRADLKELKAQINDRENKATVIPVSFRKWMSIAAGFIIVLSLAVVLYRIYYHSPEENNTIAAIKEKPKDTSAVIPKTQVDSNTVAVNEPKAAIEPAPVFIPSKKVPAIVYKDSLKEMTDDVANNDNSVATNEIKVQQPPAAAAPPPTTRPVVEKSDNARTENTGIVSYEFKKQANNVKLNKFTGKVVDEHNTPLPFANITELNSGIGTYADVNGNFNLISADTVLRIETKSVGYLGIVSHLNYNSNQKIVLKDESVVANAPTNNDFLEKYKNRKSKMEEEINETESEPVDGWKNYNTYIANNVREPIKFKEQQTGITGKNVVLSFDVQPDGNITNFKVEKSNCSSCNSEAIRLLKEGPKWKSKTGKTERTHYTVQF